MWATEFTRASSIEGCCSQVLAIVGRFPRQPDEVSRREGRGFRGMRRFLNVTLLLVLVVLPVLVRGEAVGVRRHISSLPPLCALVVASPEYAALKNQAQRLLDSRPDERAAAVLYLPGLDQNDPTVLGGIHNLTVHRVFAPAFCHAFLGLDHAIGVAMLWAGTSSGRPWQPTSSSQARTTG